MIKTFTQHDLVQYIYDELEEKVEYQLESSFKYDQNLAEECSDLLLTKAMLDKAMKAPSQKSIDAIINYSKNVSLQL
ncbi:MAG: hypothetical protein LPJ89_09160 [Hymenobacteraceae bacterium]|nr:hypothetical protein [Hymenobacteraceae bacterium]MDX5396356.1 hypothetical protein [Hymenobacteraceae bacterium]MDX5443933.1 hypothetical protein [Hymenobacteraceae bacterium]MDX5512418.1 hypothetical protein [Hymenobacteraceae bacterium]